MMNPHKRLVFLSLQCLLLAGLAQGRIGESIQDSSSSHTNNHHQSHSSPSSFASLLLRRLQDAAFGKQEEVRGDAPPMIPRQYSEFGSVTAVPTVPVADAANSNGQQPPSDSNANRNAGDLDIPGANDNAHDNANANANGGFGSQTELQGAHQAFDQAFGSQRAVPQQQPQELQGSVDLEDEQAQQAPTRGSHSPPDDDDPDLARAGYKMDSNFQFGMATPVPGNAAAGGHQSRARAGRAGAW